MPQPVKCRWCGKKLPKTEAYCVVVGGKNTYYCNQNEWNSKYEADLEEDRQKEKRKADKKRTYDLINKIFGRVITNTTLYKEIGSLVEIYPYTVISGYLTDNFDYLYDVMHRDNFSSEYGKIRYFSAILKNSLSDYLEMRKKEEVKKPVVQEDIVEMKFIRKSKRRALDDIL